MLRRPLDLDNDPLEELADVQRVVGREGHVLFANVKGSMDLRFAELDGQRGALR